MKKFWLSIIVIAMVGIGAGYFWFSGSSSAIVPGIPTSLESYIRKHERIFKMRLILRPFTPVRTVIYFKDYSTLDEVLAIIPQTATMELILYGHGEWRSTFPIPKNVARLDVAQHWSTHLRAEASAEASQQFQMEVVRQSHEAFLHAIQDAAARLVFGVVISESPRALKSHGAVYWFVAPLQGREPWVLFKGPRSAYPEK